MKTGTLREVKEKLSEFVKKSQGDYVLITKHGRPSALVMGVEGHDMEDVFYMTHPEFWKGMRKRRREKAVPFRV